MNPLKMHAIEVDEEVYSFLKNQAEPFRDTPNSVLRRFLPLKGEGNLIHSHPTEGMLRKFTDSVPSALAQILQMVILVKTEGLNRVEATRKVANLRGISTQSVIDKYCRQLGKKAREIDDFLVHSNLNLFERLLVLRFRDHKDVIESTFREIGVAISDNGTQKGCENRTVVGGANTM
ncbi:hypothetical protein ACFLWB_02625 [Chloroflexota bacterium]